MTQSGSCRKGIRGAPHLPTRYPWGWRPKRDGRAPSGVPAAGTPARPARLGSARPRRQLGPGGGAPLPAEEGHPPTHLPRLAPIRPFPGDGGRGPGREGAGSPRRSAPPRARPARGLPAHARCRRVGRGERPAVPAGPGCPRPERSPFGRAGGAALPRGFPRNHPPSPPCDAAGSAWG